MSLQNEGEYKIMIKAYIADYEINEFALKNEKYFEKSEIESLKNMIADSNITLSELNTFDFKSPKIGVLLSVVLGILGIDRMYSENYVMAILKFFTLGGFGFWWIIDLFLIGKAVKTNNMIRLSLFLKGGTKPRLIDVIKSLFKSKEVRESVAEYIKSTKDVFDTFDPDK